MRSAIASCTVVALALPLASMAKNNEGREFRVRVESPKQCTIAFREWVHAKTLEQRRWLKEHRNDEDFKTALKEFRKKSQADQKDAVKRLQACLRGEYMSSSSWSSSATSNASSTASSLSSGSSVSSQWSSKSSQSFREACMAKCPDGHEYRKCAKPGLPIYYFADPCMGHYGSSNSSSSKSSVSSVSSSSSMMSSSSTVSSSSLSSLSSSSVSSMSSAMSSVSSQ